MALAVPVLNLNTRVLFSSAVYTDITLMGLQPGFEKFDVRIILIKDDFVNELLR